MRGFLREALNVPLIDCSLNGRLLCSGAKCWHNIHAHEHGLMDSLPVLEIVRKSWLCEGITGTRNRLLFPGLILQTDPIRSQHRVSSVPELRVGSWN